MDRWDPIGVRAIPAARGEYDQYVPSLCKLLLDRRPKEELVDYLWRLETEHMGLTGDRQATEAFADYLCDLTRQL